MGPRGLVLTPALPFPGVGAPGEAPPRGWRKRAADEIGLWTARPFVGWCLSKAHAVLQSPGPGTQQPAWGCQIQRAGRGCQDTSEHHGPLSATGAGPSRSHWAGRSLLFSEATRGRGLRGPPLPSGCPAHLRSDAKRCRPAGTPGCCVGADPRDPRQQEPPRAMQGDEGSRLPGAF